jgi:hypothetical protein
MMSPFVEFTRISPPPAGAITLHIREINAIEQQNRGACAVVICYDGTSYTTTDHYEVVRQRVLAARDDQS